MCIVHVPPPLHPIIYPCTAQILNWVKSLIYYVYLAQNFTHKIIKFLVTALSKPKLSKRGQGRNWGWGLRGSHRPPIWNFLYRQRIYIYSVLWRSYRTCPPCARISFNVNVSSKVDCYLFNLNIITLVDNVYIYSLWGLA